MRFKEETWFAIKERSLFVESKFGLVARNCQQSQPTQARISDASRNPLMLRDSTQVVNAGQR
jgi:hypothetical protein